MFNAVTDSLLSLIYPQQCRVCGKGVERAANGLTCGDCWSSTRIFSGNETLCKKCRAFLFEGTSTAGAFCKNCNDHHYDRAFATGAYEGALAAAILNLKSIPHLSRKVQDLIIKTSSDFINGSKPLVIPIPLSQKRFHERGFNQAAVIAKIVCNCNRLELDEQSLVRKIHTPIHRAAMDRKARETTVTNAFQVVRPRLIASRNILLVDDVLTSGATASNCAKVLKKAGATSVTVFTLARAAS